MPDRNSGKSADRERSDLAARLKEMRATGDAPVPKSAKGKVDENQFTPRATAELSAKALVGNYRAIADLVPDQAIIPMIKANAYGHGAEWAAKTLREEPRLAGFGVASLEEGAEVREALGVRGRRTPVTVYSGCANWSEAKGRYCEAHGLTAVIASEEDLRAFVSQGWAERISYEVKFNTGMNRLGVHPSQVRQVIKLLQGLPPERHPEGFLTHLAMSENVEAKLTLQQLERFASLKSELSSAFPSAQYSLANSGAIWNQKNLGLDRLSDRVRPGLSLYGVPPWAGAPERGLQPVLTLKATVIALHTLKPGESIGYGATYQVPTTAKGGGVPASVRVAILSAGYADGVKRMLSNQGHAWLGGAPTRFLGIVSMDLSAVAVVGAGAATRIGDQAEILGPHVDIWAQARAANTIPYELLTSLSDRVQRMYV
jgi:alanine racemase